MTMFDTNNPATDLMQARTEELLSHVSFEALPSKILKDKDILRQLPHASIYIPYLPGANLADTVAAATHLQTNNRQAVPHLPARTFTGETELDEWLGQLRETGVDHILLIAGDTGEKRGPFTDTRDVIATGLIEKHGFSEVSVAGHPEGHPIADEPALREALAQKVAWARAANLKLRVVTQFSFDMQACLDWIEGLNDILDGTPVHLGLAGPASPTTLFKYALMCGVSVSGQMMLKNANARKLVTHWQPDDMLAALAASPNGPAGLHIFPFGGIKKTANWVEKNSSR